MASVFDAVPGALQGGAVGAQFGGPVGAGVGAVLGGAASIMGADAVTQAQKDAAKKIQANQEALKQYLESIGVPTEDAITYASQKYPMPEELKPSLMADVNLDPRLQETRMAALVKLQNISDAGGLDAQSQAALDEAMGQVAIQERGQREAIDMAAQRRGMSGSGIEAVQQQMNAQNAANQSRSAGLQQAATAQQRALAALTQGANLAGSMSAEDIALKSNKATAQDAVEKFNNTGRNLTNQANIDLTNKDSANKAAAPLQVYNANMTKAQILGGNTNTANNTIADIGKTNAANAAAQGQAITGAATAAGNAYSQYVKDEEAKKKAKTPAV